MFFDITTINKIFFEKDYPSLSFYIIYGIISNILAWIIHYLLRLLISNDKKINNEINTNREILNEPQSLDYVKQVEPQVDKLISSIRIKLIIFNVIEFVLFIFCFIYLSICGSVYKGTKKYVFRAYGISLLEILIIRIVYAFILGFLRWLSLTINSINLYKVTNFIDLYIS